MLDCSRCGRPLKSKDELAKAGGGARRSWCKSCESKRVVEARRRREERIAASGVVPPPTR